MSERTRARITALEALLAAQDDGPSMPVKVLVSERSFESTETLKRWSAAHAAEGRARARGVESESFAAIKLMVVRRCLPSEQPSARECGVLVPVPAKASGEVPS